MREDTDERLGPLACNRREPTLDTPGRTLTLDRNRRSVILVADDEPVTRLILRTLLKANYDVLEAKDGREALDIYHRHQPDLVLVDVQMPELSGPEVCEQIRAEETEAHTPILLMSTHSGEELVLSGLARGADDFIVKPVHQRMLLSKISAQLAGKNSRDLLAFQRERLLALQQEAAHEQFVAHSVLKNILGRAELNHPSIRYLLTAMTGFDGDVALVAKLPSGGLRMMVSDVVGHGLPAALGTIPISLLFYSTTRRGLDLSVAMQDINRELCGVLPTGLFASAAAFEVDPNSSILRVWNGGMPDLVLRCRHTTELVRFASQNIPIGIAPSDSSVVQEAPVQAGDIVFAMSDGVSEARNAKGELFGIEGVLEALSADRPVDELFDDLSNRLSRFAQGRQDDDITLLAHTVGRTSTEHIETRVRSEDFSLCASAPGARSET